MNYKKEEALIEKIHDFLENHDLDKEEKWNSNISYWLIYKIFYYLESDYKFSINKFELSIEKLDKSIFKTISKYRLKYEIVEKYFKYKCGNTYFEKSIFRNSFLRKKGNTKSYVLAFSVYEKYIKTFAKLENLDLLIENLKCIASKDKFVNF